jgi:hypothetical protein
MNNHKPPETQDFPCATSASRPSDSPLSPGSPDSHQSTLRNAGTDIQNRIDRVANFHDADTAIPDTGADPQMAGSFIKHLK